MTVKVEFVGRQRELKIVRDAVDSNKVLWVTGTGGIGKSALVNQVLKQRTTRTINGAWFPEFEDAVAWFTEGGDTEPQSRSFSGIAQWLADVLPEVLAGDEVLVWEDFHLTCERFVGIFLSTLRTTLVPVPVILIGRDFHEVPGLLTNRIRHLPLAPLTGEESRQFCVAHKGKFEELPSTVMGHPFLMRVYLEDGLTELESWHRQVLGERTAAELALLTRLALSQTLAQRSWAVAENDREKLVPLKGVGAINSTCEVPEMMRMQLREVVGHAEWQTAERSLLDYLVSAEEISRFDLIRARELCVQYPENNSMAELLQNHGGKIADEGELAHLQKEIERLVVEKSLPAKAFLSRVRANVFPERVTVYLAHHDRLIESVLLEERRFAQVCFLKAATISGVYPLPDLTEEYWEEIKACPSLEPEVKQQVAFGLISAFINPDSNDGRPVGELLQFIEQGARSDRLRMAYQMLLKGFTAAREHSALDAFAFMEKASHLFASEELPIHVNAVERYMMVMAYLFLDDERLEKIIGSQKRNNLFQRYELLDMFSAVLEWQRGNTKVFDAEAFGLGTPVVTSGRRDLPGPYAEDFVLYFFAVFAERERGAVPRKDCVDAFCEAGRSIRLYVVFGSALISLVEHCMLCGDLDSSKRLIAATGGWKELNSQREFLLYLMDHQQKPPELETLFEKFDAACVRSDRLTIPYFVVLVGRLFYHHNLNLAPLIKYVEASSIKTAFRGRPRQIIERSTELFRHFTRRPEHWDAQDIIDDYLFSGQGGREFGVNAKFPADVEKLKTILDENWFGSIDVQGFAAEQGLTTKSVSRKFKEFVGKSPKQYQQAKRISEASMLLVETDWSLSDIAYECGYYDSSQFSRLFKESVGTTPSKYRKERRAS